jgi:rod shape-determining protein MreC
VERTGLRTIAVGSGNAGELLLPYLAVNSDVRSGDVLQSSGLGGVFPAGVPVGRITGVHRQANQLLAQVRAEPLARLDRSREVMLVEFDPANPAAPPTAQALAEGASPDVAAPANAKASRPDDKSPDDKPNHGRARPRPKS